MKIHFTKNEYRTLLEILAMAEWVMHSHETEPNPELTPYDQLIQKLLSVARDFRSDDLVEYSKESNTYYNNILEDIESPVSDIMREYELESFWEELCYRLGERDLIEELGQQETQALEYSERAGKIADHSQKYYEEFEERGLQYLKIVKP